MNFAAILPRLPQFAFQLRPARAHQPAAPVIAPEQRAIARGAIITLENRRLQVCVLRGCVWITRDGCPADVVLTAGDVFNQLPGAKVLVQALEDAELLIADAAVRAQNA